MRLFGQPHGPTASESMLGVLRRWHSQCALQLCTLLYNGPSPCSLSSPCNQHLSCSLFLSLLSSVPNQLLPPLSVALCICQLPCEVCKASCPLVQVRSLHVCMPWVVSL